MELLNASKNTCQRKQSQSKLFSTDEGVQMGKAQAKQVRWEIEENKVYAEFLKENSYKFASEHLRRSTKVFMSLSEILGSKSASQCKSHHQKMMKTHRSLEKIIHYCKNLENKRQYRTQKSLNLASTNLIQQAKQQTETLKPEDAESIVNLETFLGNEQNQGNSDQQIFKVVNFFEC